MKEENKRLAASLVNNPTSVQEEKRGAGRGLFFAVSNKENKMNQPCRSPRPPLAAPNNDLHSKFPLLHLDSFMSKV